MILRGSKREGRGERDIGERDTPIGCPPTYTHTHRPGVTLAAQARTLDQEPTLPCARLVR